MEPKRLQITKTTLSKTKTIPDQSYITEPQQQQKTKQNKTQQNTTNKILLPKIQNVDQWNKIDNLNMNCIATVI